jgi:putative ABC transport system ATP-binding protein
VWHFRYIDLDLFIHLKYFSNMVPDYNIAARAEMQGVYKSFNGSTMEQKVLHDVSFSAFPCEFILLLGPSGSGKTTLLTLLGAMQQPSKGKVYLFGKETTMYKAGDIQRMRAGRMGFVFQTFNLIESLSVLENLLLIQQFSGIAADQAKKNALKLLDEMQLLHHCNSLPKTMSQGEKQRVAVARALINDAQLIIADEPTGSLNSEMGLHVVKLLKEAVVNKGLCVIVASHDERLINFSDRVLQLQDGILKERQDKLQIKLDNV